MHVSRTLTAVVLVVTLGAAACSDGDPDAAAETAGPTDEPTTESQNPSSSPTPAQAAVDPTVVPDEITVEYLDAVMDRFDEMTAEVYAMLADTGDTRHPPMIEKYISFVEAGLATQTIDAVEELFGQDGLASPPLPPETNVDKIVDVKSDCVLFHATRTLQPLLDEGVEYNPGQPHVLELRRTESTRLNPTPWQLHRDGYHVEGSDVPTECGK